MCHSYTWWMLKIKTECDKVGQPPRVADSQELQLRHNDKKIDNQLNEFNEKSKLFNNSDMTMNMKWVFRFRFFFFTFLCGAWWLRKLSRSQSLFYFHPLFGLILILMLLQQYFRATILQQTTQGVKIQSSVTECMVIQNSQQTLIKQSTD